MSEEHTPLSVALSQLKLGFKKVTVRRWHVQDAQPTKTFHKRQHRHPNGQRLRRRLQRHQSSTLGCKRTIQRRNTLLPKHHT